MKVYSQGRLAWYEVRADQPEFWTSHWQEADVQTWLDQARTGALHDLEEPLAQWLPRDAPILEGGCGVGQIVLALQSRGYQVVGVEFSAETVTRTKALAPDCNVEVGDVFRLDYPDGYFGAYISLGVVEHYFDGPPKILAEAYRVLRPEGVLLCSVPYLSPIRRLRIRLGDYKAPNPLPPRETFYQYAFSQQEFISFLTKAGFSIVEVLFYDPILGARKELWGFERIYRRNDGLSWRLQRLFRSNALLKKWLAHMVLLVARKNI